MKIGLLLTLAFFTSSAFALGQCPGSSRFDQRSNRCHHYLERYSETPDIWEITSYLNWIGGKCDELYATARPHYNEQADTLCAGGSNRASVFAVHTGEHLCGTRELADGTDEIVLTMAIYCMDGKATQPQDIELCERSIADFLTDWKERGEFPVTTYLDSTPKISTARMSSACAYRFDQLKERIDQAQDARTRDQLIDQLATTECPLIIENGAELGRDCFCSRDRCEVVERP